jgi:DNA polymerase III epsilon subunit-like protein
MILCSIDFETTGTNIISDRPIEYGAVLYSTKTHRMLDAQSMLVKTDVPVSPKITKITGVVKPMLDRFGYEQSDVLPLMVQMVETADAVIGYNCRRFDQHIFNEWCKRENVPIQPDKVWIDLFYDLPWTVPTGKLSHVAADHGILNLFPHSALSDCQTVLAIAAKYDDNLLLSRATSPTVVLRSLAERSQNDLVKEAKFRWNPSFKIWWKPIKEQDIKEVSESLPFSVVVDDRTADELES